MRHAIRAARILTITLILSGLCSAVALAGPTVRSASLEVRLSDDLNAVESIVDSQGRELAATETTPEGLYQLTLGGGRWKTTKLSSLDAVKRSCTPIENGLELRFEHDGDCPVEVICRVQGTQEDPMLRWTIEVENRSRYPVPVVTFPRAILTLPLGSDPTDDAIVHPVMEGALLNNPAKHFKQPQTIRETYPGRLSSQFVYYFDPQGGFYSAALDGQGYPKELSVGRDAEALEIAWTHQFSRAEPKSVATSYDVVWASDDGTWQAGASLYRDWAHQQSWCAKKLTERDVPQWLTRANVFLNFSIRDPNRFFPASVAAKTFEQYREFLGKPLVCTAFSWERHGSWIGPEYFPPYGDDQTYIDLANALSKHDSHLQLYLSGFRWGVRKPTSERVDQPRRYTDYDGMPLWEKEGKDATVITMQGDLSYAEVPWADNYSICAGSQQARDVLARGFEKAFGWGVTGVDLDQNIGGQIPICYSHNHDHASGAGLWQHQAMAGFLDGVRTKAQQNDPNCFLGVEEPCESYIPWFDAFHGRSFTDNVWPAVGPGVSAIPLYIYLYHEYEIGYAGWIDNNFSPSGDVRIGLGRAFLFGMQPGVRLSSPEFILDENEPSEQLQMLRRVAQLIDEHRRFLLLGRMLDEPRITGSPMLPKAEAKGRRRPMAISWPVVQATAWQAADGDVLYAVANLSDQPQTVAMEPAGGGSMRLNLAPWEMRCIEQAKQ